MGPLAPRRNAGQQADLYGVSESERVQFPKVTDAAKKKYINIVAGDRVVVVRGRGRGKIGKVTNVSTNEETVTIEGVNLVCHSCQLARISFTLEP